MFFSSHRVFGSDVIFCLYFYSLGAHDQRISVGGAVLMLGVNWLASVKKWNRENNKQTIIWCVCGCCGDGSRSEKTAHVQKITTCSISGTKLVTPRSITI